MRPITRQYTDTISEADGAIPKDEELLERARNASNGEKFERLWFNTSAILETGMDCPTYGGSVTLEIRPDRPFSRSLTDALLAADKDEYIDVLRDCWNCGWHEERQIGVESIDTTDGDEVAVERAVLVDEITDELAAINSLATLEDACAEIRRQCRRASATTDAEDDHME